MIEDNKEDIEKKPIEEETDQKSRCRFFVLTHWKPDTVKTQLEQIKKDLQYSAYQFEKCPETKKEHAHIFLWFRTVKSYKQVGGYFPNPTGETTWVKRPINIEQAIQYCTTDPFIDSKGVAKAKGRYDGPWEDGKRPAGQGFRSDIKDMIESGKKRKREVMEECPVLLQRYERFYYTIQNLENSKKDKWIGAEIIPSCMSEENLLKDLKIQGIEAYDIFVVNRDVAKKNMIWDGYESQPFLVVDQACLGLVPKTRIPLDIKNFHVYPCWTKVYVFGYKADQSIQYYTL